MRVADDDHRLFLPSTVLPSTVIPAKSVGDTVGGGSEDVQAFAVFPGVFGGAIFSGAFSAALASAFSSTAFGRMLK